MAVACNSLPNYAVSRKLNYPSVLDDLLGIESPEIYLLGRFGFAIELASLQASS